MVGEHRQEGLPGAHLGAELLSHDASDLSDVPEVVHDPGCQELTERYVSSLEALEATMTRRGCDRQAQRTWAEEAS